MPYSAGTAFLQVVPSFRDVEKSMRRHVADLGKSIEKSVSGALPAGMAEGARAARREGERAGDEYSGALAAAIRRATSKARKALPEVEINADSSEAEKAVDRIRRSLGEIHDQHVNLELDDATALHALKRFERELTDINRSATTVTLHANTAAASRELRDALKFSDTFFDTSKVSKLADDKFATDFRKAVKAAEKDLPELSVRVDRTDADTEIAEIRSELKRLGDVDIVGIDISDGEALAKLRELQDRLQVLHDSAGDDLRLEADTSAALAKIETFYKTVQARRLAAEREAKAASDREVAEAAKAAAKIELERKRERDRDARDEARSLKERARDLKREADTEARETSRRTRDSAKSAAKSADDEMGGFARRFRDQMDTAFKAVRRVDVDAEPAQLQLQKLRAQLEALRDAHVGVDLDTGTALAQVKEIRAQLEKLARGTRDIQVRADIAQAYASLSVIQRLADHLDGRHVNLDVNLDDAAKGVENIGTAADAPLSRLGALIAVSAALGPAIVPAAAAAAVAIGAIGTAAAAAAAGVGVVALSMFGVADAVKALDAYQQDVKKSAKSVSGAENQVANAIDGVTGAERSLRRAREDSAFSAKRSEQQVAAARRSVTDADKEAVKAQLDLVDAIKAVRQEEEDRTLQLRDNELAQRQANLDLAEAKKDLDKLLANPRATKAEREQARITFEERTLQLDQLTVQQRRLTDEQTDAAKKGVEGSDRVVAAQERIAATQQSVADANLNLTNAIEDQKRQQVASADAILSAQQSLTQAQRTLSQAYKTSGVAGGDALDTLKQKMDALSPAGQRFALFIFGLKDEFLSLRDAAAEGFLPGAQQAISNLLPYLPKVRDYIGEVATAVGDIATRVTASFGNPGWQKFFTFIGQQTVPVLNGLATVTTNLTEGTRDLFLALTAFNKPIGRGLIDMSESFAKWAAQLEGSTGYKKFLAYVQDVGPDVVDFFLELGKAIAKIIEAAAPVGKVVLAILDSILQLINALPTGALTVIIGVVAVLSTGLLAVSTVLKVAKAAVEAKNGALLIYANTIGRATAALGAYRTAESATLTGSGGFSKSLGVTTASVDSLSTATTRSAAPAAAMKKSLDGLSESTTKTGSAAAGMASLLGGPWSLAVIGAGVALSFLVAQHDAEQQQAEDNIKAFEQLGQAITKTGTIQSNEAKQTILQSDSLKQLTLDIEDIAKKAGDFDTKLADVARTHGTVAQAEALSGRAAQDYGTDLDTLARALTGNKTAQQQLLDTLQRASDPQNGGDEKLRALAAARREELVKLFAQMDLQVRIEGALADAAAGTGDAFVNASGGLKSYVESLGVLADASSTAAQKSDALRQAEDTLFGSQRSLQESMEAQARALRDRNKLLTDEKLLQQTGAKQLDIKTEAGARLTDALEAELEAINATFRANVAAGKSISEATVEHDKEVEALRKAAKEKGLDEQATQRLIDIYGQVPTSRVTDFATTNFGTTKAQLDELMAYQLALREGISLDQARARLHPDINQAVGKGNSQGAHLATGGPVRGPGTGTSDSVRAWIPETGTPFRLSDGEFVHKAAAVDYYGHGFMEAINEERLPKELLGMIGFGFAGGGLIQQERENYPFPFNANVTKVPTRAEVAKAAILNSDNLGPTGAGPGFLPWPSSPMAQRGDTGVWRSIVDLVRNSGIPYKFGNAYRAGDPLWHGSGRAVDFMGYNQDQLANFFLARQNRLLELIHLTPRSGYFVTRGKRKANFAVQGPLHRNHLHVAMAGGGLVGSVPQLKASFGTFDQGGALPPGYTLAYNGTGQNEQVLTSRQMADIQLSAKQSAASGNAYHFAFRDTTLDASKLRAIQNREAALARVGRAR